MKWLVWTLLVTPWVQADDTALRVLALDGALGDGAPAVVERVLGEDAVIHLALLPPPGAADNHKLHAEVMLSGGTLATPMGADFPFRPADASTHPALLEGSLRLPSPDTAQSITQIVTLRRTDARSTVASFTLRWVSLAECRAALTIMVAGDASRQSQRLLVCGPLPGLREQLHTWKVPFDDLHGDFPSRVPSNSLLIASDVPEATREPELADGASLFIVHRRTSRGLEVLRNKHRVSCTEVWLFGAPDWRRSAHLMRLLTDHLKLTSPSSAL